MADTAPVTRRNFLWMGWAALVSFLGAGAAATGRFFFPNVIYEPSQKFNAGSANSYDIGVSTKWLNEQRVWIVRTEAGIYALWARCTHLGCTPNWFGDQQRFRCPCHGSIYDVSGNVVGGPAPRTLWRAGIALDPVDGQIVVNFTQRQDPDPKGTPEGLMVEEKSREVAPFFLTI